MGMTPTEYKNQLAQFLPRGKAWEMPIDGQMDHLIAGLAVEFSRIDIRGDDIIKESDPRTTFELLQDWERVLGLPDDCTGPAPTIEERRNQIVSKLVTVGGQSKAFLKSIATSLGYDVDIEEYDPFRVGSRVGDRLYSLPWVHVFGLNSNASESRFFRVNKSHVGERLREFGNDILECLISRAKPSHSRAIFKYIEEGV